MNIDLSCSGKEIKNATWSDIESILPELKKEASLRIYIDPEPDSGPLFLDIQSEDGYYMPIMLVRGESGDRAFVNEENRDKEDVTIGGYDVDAMAVTQDFDLIVRMIREFYETGDVSGDLLK